MSKHRPAHRLPGDITGLLVGWSDGDRGALAHVALLEYEVLHTIAAPYLRKERRNHTLGHTIPPVTEAAEMYGRMGPAGERIKNTEQLLATVRSKVE